MYLPALGLAALGFSNLALFYAVLLFQVPGLVLIIAPTLAMYLPIADAVFTGIRRRKRGLIGIGLALGAAIGLGLPLIGGLSLNQQIAQARRDDFVGARPPSPRRMLYAERSQHRVRTACDELCARLLLSGAVDTVVRPRDWPTSGQALNGAAIVYSLRRTSPCPPMPEHELAVSEVTRVVIGAGNCIARDEVPTPEIDGGMAVEDWYGGRSGNFELFAKPTRVTQRVAWRCDGGTCRPTARATAIEAERLKLPLTVGLRRGGQVLEVHRAWARRQEKLGDTTNDAFMRVHLGLAGPETALPTSAHLKDIVLGFLAASAEAPRSLTDEEMAALQMSLWTMADYPQALDASALEVLASVASHPRVDHVSRFMSVFRRHPYAADAIADTLVVNFVRLSVNETGRQHALRRDLAEAIALLPADSFAQHGGELLRAAAADRYAMRGAPNFIARLPELGSQAAPVLLAAVELPEDGRVAVRALCSMGAAASKAVEQLALNCTPSGG